MPDFQLSLAIGKEGQNARLAAKLTGWKIDIKSESQLRAQIEQELLNYNAQSDQEIPVGEEETTAESLFIESDDEMESLFIDQDDINEDEIDESVYAAPSEIEIDEAEPDEQYNLSLIHIYCAVHPNDMSNRCFHRNNRAHPFLLKTGNRKVQ